MTFKLPVPLFPATLYHYDLFIAPDIRLCKSYRKAYVGKIGIYARDSFSFEGSQRLGWWGLPNIVSIIPIPGLTEEISNAWFRNYQRTTGLGSDFLIYSDWKMTRLNEMVEFDY